MISSLPRLAFMRRVHLAKCNGKIRMIAGVFSLLFLSAGCTDFQYYRQAVSGHLKILDRKQSIVELMSAPNTEPGLSEKLRLILEVRQFAIDSLMLPEVEGYTEYADIGQPYVSTLVTASPPLSLESYQWCFLFVGCVEYRGYFNEEEALQYSLELHQEKGLDIAIGHATAYSTLGWLSWLPDYFKDPVLNTFVELDETEIISTLIHEMAHQVVYVPDDTTFNESFAVFVEQEGLRQYLNRKHGPDSATYSKYLQEHQDETLFREIVTEFYDRLDQLYQSDLPDQEKLAQKAVILGELSATYTRRESEFKMLSFKKWFSRPLNNAHLMGVKRYHDYMDVFAHVFEEEQRDWERFFNRVLAIADDSGEERQVFYDQYRKRQANQENPL